MPVEVRLLKVGMTMTEGTVEEWFIADGDQVEKGEMLYRLETEKVNMDVDAEAAGTVKHLVGAGTELGPGDVIGFIFAPDETIPDVLPTPTPLPGEEPVEEKKAPRPAATTPAPAAKRAAGRRPAASPAARRLAAELDVDLADVDGTGPRGRITEGDVTAHAAKAKPEPQPRRRQPSSPGSPQTGRRTGCRYRFSGRHRSRRPHHAGRTYRAAPPKRSRPSPPRRRCAVCGAPSPNACTRACRTRRNSPWRWKSTWKTP